jgi:hypothetical protein
VVSVLAFIVGFLFGEWASRRAPGVVSEAPKVLSMLGVAKAEKRKPKVNDDAKAVKLERERST